MKWQGLVRKSRNTLYLSDTVPITQLAPQRSGSCLNRRRSFSFGSYLLSPDSSRSGFTLVELLVVILIISILIALLLPALAAARRQGLAVGCLSNLHQIGTGMLMYENENNGYLPPAVINEGVATVPNQQESWDQFLEPYVGDSVAVTNPGQNNVQTTTVPNNIFRCPADDMVRYNDCAPRSYSMITFYTNVWTGGGTYPPVESYLQPIRAMQIQNPSEVIQVIEWHNGINLRGGNWLSWCPYNWYRDYSNPLFQSSLSYTPDLGQVHGNGSNFLFFDGHAGFLLLGDAVDIGPFPSNQNFLKHWWQGN